MAGNPLHSHIGKMQNVSLSISMMYLHEEMKDRAFQSKLKQSLIALDIEFALNMFIRATLVFHATVQN